MQPANPATGVSLPRIRETEKRFLTHQQVHELAEACGDEYRLVVLFLAYTGLRWGEMAALRVRRNRLPTPSGARSGVRDTRSGRHDVGRDEGA